MNKISFFLRIALFSSCLVVCSASAENPFDLIHRLPKKSIDSISLKSKIPENPFNIVHKRENNKGKGTLIKKLETKKLKFEFNKDIGISKAGFFWIFVLAFGVLLLISLISRSVFSKIKETVLNFKKLKTYKREILNFYAIPLLLLFVFSLFNLAIFVFYLIRYYTDFYSNLPASREISILFLLLLSVFIGKHLIWFFLGKVLKVDKTIENYQFLMINFYALMGLVLFPINFIIAYVPPDYVKIFLLAGILSLLIIIVYRVYIGLILGRKYIFESFFHFLLYICTVEIAPFIILLKFLAQKTEF